MASKPNQVCLQIQRTLNAITSASLFTSVKRTWLVQLRLSLCMISLSATVNTDWTRSFQSPLRMTAAWFHAGPGAFPMTSKQPTVLKHCIRFADSSTVRDRHSYQHDAVRTRWSDWRGALKHAALCLTCNQSSSLTKHQQLYTHHHCLMHFIWMPCKHISKTTRMWANAQRDGRPAKHRWRPLFNAANYGWRPLLDAVQ